MTSALIHPSAVVAGDTELGATAFIGAFCLVGVDGDGPALVIGAAPVLRSHSVIYRGSRIGDRFHAGHGTLVREHAVFGDDVSVGSHTVVEHDVTLGDRVRLHSGCFLPEETVVGDGAWIGPGVIVTNARHPNRHDTKANLEGVLIGSGAVIGAGVVLLPGVRIGSGATVGAGAVVVHDVAAGATVVGNPARPIRGD